MIDSHNRLYLSSADVEQLLNDPSEQNRALTARKVGGQLEDLSLTPEQRLMAEEIIRIMTGDAMVMVREAIVDTLKSSPHLPRDVALRLARDIESVAVPIIELSPKLEDRDLLALIDTGHAAKHIAIANRAIVSDVVATALVEKAAEPAIAVLTANKGADLSPQNLGKIIDKFGGSEAILTNVAQRPVVPPVILEQLIAIASTNLQAVLTKRGDLPAHIAQDLIKEGQEKATIRMLGRGRSDDELTALIKQLQANKRLSASLILRAVCTGDVQFFEVALATLARIPLKNARMLIHDRGGLGLASLYERCGLPSNVFPAIRHALAIAAETTFDGGTDDLERRNRRLIERILSDPQGMSEDDINFLFEKLIGVNI